jgi:hypothetical protein
MAWSCPTRQGNQNNRMNTITPSIPQPTSTVPPQVNTTTNRTMQQVPQGDANNNNAFITQEEEIPQPVTTVWEGLQHLN